MGRFDNIFSSTVAPASSTGTGGKFANIFANTAPTSRPLPSVQVPSAVQNFPGTVGTLAGLQTDPFSLKSNPLNFFSAAWDTIKGAVTQEATNIKNLFDSLDHRTPQQVMAQPSAQGTSSQSVAAALKTVSGAANVVFSPVSALFSGAQQIPILGTVSKLITLPFEATGEAIPHATNYLIDQLPISQQTKENLKPAIGDIFALAGQIALGSAVELGTRKLISESPKVNMVKAELVQQDPTITAKVPDSTFADLIQKHGEDATKTIVTQAVQLADKIQNKYQVDLSPQGTIRDINIPEVPKTMMDTLIEQRQRGTPTIDITGPIGDFTKPYEPVLSPEVKGVSTVGRFDTLFQPTALNPLEGSKVTKASSDISSSLASLGFKELSPAEQARFNPITKSMQIAKVDSLLNADYQSALDMAKGNKPVPIDVSPQVLFNAVKNKAISEADPATLRDLAISPIATERSVAAQTLSAAGFNNFESDPVRAIQEVQALRQKSVKIKDFPAAQKTVVDSIKTEIKKVAPTKQTWQDFVNSIQC